MELADLGPDPFVAFGTWFAEVQAARLPEPTAMVLATAGADGRPRARHVLLKGHGPAGFRFFTNRRSLKARQLGENPFASLVFPWFPIRRQVIVAGPVEPLDAAEDDAYFASRDRGSQLGAWASVQSEEIPDRAWLEGRYAEFDERFAGLVPRPPHWGGYRVVPDNFEFWAGRPDRLHDRFRYSLAADGAWTRARLSP